MMCRRLPGRFTIRTGKARATGRSTRRTPARSAVCVVVCVGFTEQGDPVINDPGTTLNVRKTFPRQNLIAAWAYSRNAAYLIYPADAEVPKDRFGHWASWTSRRRIILKR